MRVELLTSRVDLRQRYEIGDIIDVPADEARRLLTSNPPQAKPVRQETRESATAAASPEFAITAPTEQAARRTSPRSRS